MNTNIINGAPMSRNLGIQDVSGRTVAPTPEERPTHLPKVYGYAQKGPVGQAYPVVGDSRASIFGVDSFDMRKPWANHATEFSNVFSRAGNTQMFQRIKPADAPDPASIRLMLDLLPTEVQDFERNADGTYRRTTGGALVPNATKTPGFLAKWVVEKVTSPVGEEDEDNFGKADPSAGDQTDVGTSTQSTRYPIMDLRVSSFGSWGNNQSIRLWAPTTESGNTIDRRLVNDQMAYQFFIGCGNRPDALTSTRPTSTLSGNQFIPFVLKPGLIDRNTDRQLHLGDVFLDAYQDVSTPGMSPKFGPFGDIHVYDNHVATVLADVYAAEYAAAGLHTDFEGVDDEEYRFNLISGTTSTGVPYHSFQVVTGAGNSVSLTENSYVFAQGGGDGTMNDVEFAKLVTAELLEYANPSSPLMDSATYPESIFYDSGFPLETKKAMASLLAVRKDLAVVAGVYEVGGPTLTDDQERSLATVLLTHFQAFAESSYFGTPAARACIVGSSGFALKSQFKPRLPATYEMAIKAAAYMGAGNGKWKSGLAFDQAPLSQVDNMRDIALPFRPADARNKDWEVGLIWPQSYSRSRSFFPQFQTVYPDDTSVLNNFFTMMACIELQKIGEAVHRDFSGVSSLTPDQLIERINAKILADVTDKFDGRYEIEPSTTFTADDKLRGYSWTTTIKLRSPMMSTVQTLIIQTERREDNS